MTFRAALVAGVALVLTACSTTVPGDPTVDAASMPQPDTGSYPVAPRTVGAPTPGESEVLEGARMIARIPLISSIDGNYRFGRRSPAGRYDRETFAGIYGSVAAARLAATEMIAEVSAGTLPGTRDVSAANQLVVSLLRLPTPEAAAAAVTPALLTPDDGAGRPAKVPVGIPGIANAVAYSQDWGRSGVRTLAFVPTGQFVMAVYGTFTAEQIRRLADALTTSLKGFVPTPLASLATLPNDETGLARLTLPPPSGSGYSVPIASMLPSETDTVAAKKAFDDAGVDAVGYGADFVFRARDGKGAAVVAAMFLETSRAEQPTASFDPVRGVPGGRCVDRVTSAGTTTWCYAAVGRYAVRVRDRVRQSAVQALGASYVLLRNQK